MNTYTATYAGKSYIIEAKSHEEARRTAVALFTTYTRPNSFAITVKKTA